MKADSYILGLDMGVASIGWACIFKNEQKIDCGVRVYPSAYDAFDTPKESHPNQDRRTARTMRRRIRRKAERKKLIRSILTDLGWLPREGPALDTWLKHDPYKLRHRAIREKISLPELARIILHLNQRRGFLSLRKSEDASADKDTLGMLGDIHAMQREVEESGNHTLGAHLHQKHLAHGLHAKLRGTRFNRDMLHREFSLIWEEQAKHHQELTPALRYGTLGPRKNAVRVAKPSPLPKDTTLLDRYGLENLTFFQRSVYWPEETIGLCEYEAANGHKRAPIADRRFQQFRMLNEVNNLKVTDFSKEGTPGERPLHPHERTICIDYLIGKERGKLEDLKKILCKQSADLPNEPAQVTFNLESGGRTTISATPTDSKLRHKKSYGPAWDKLPDATKNAVVTTLTHPTDTDEDIAAKLAEIPGIDRAAIPRLLATSLPTGYGHLSIVALEKLIPHMIDGRLYMHKEFEKSALAAAGYPRRDQREHNVYELLPLFDDLTRSGSERFDPNQTVVNSPVVKRALVEMRKIINALIRKYGKPTRIHVEMARNLKMTTHQREKYNKRIRGFEKERSEAAKILEDNRIVPTRDSVQLIQLWQQQKETCPYTGQRISLTQLLGGGGEIDIDHIFPFSRSGDDSLTNKVVCMASANREKKDRTPYEWLSASDPARFEEILQRTKDYPQGKAKRFFATEIPEGFMNRDLNDTAWMARAARQYLSLLFPPRTNRVIGTKGSYTALLREHWSLHGLLRNDGIDLKNRDDHRHHALDAIVIALCDQTLIGKLTARQKFSLKAKEAREQGKTLYHLRHDGDKLPPPWENFRDDVGKSLNAIWVSHRPRRKISGKIHKETNYGKTQDGLLVVRKPIQSLSQKDIEGIRDNGIYKIVKQFIEDHGKDIAALKTISDANPLTRPNKNHPDKPIPIRKVRIAIPYAHLTLPPNAKRDFPLHVQSAATHHLAIFALGNDKFHFEPVTLYEATRRLRAREPVVRTSPPADHPEAEFLFHLCPGDSIMADIDGKEQLFVYNTMASTTGQVWFAFHTDAAQGHKDSDTGKDLRKSTTPGTFAKNFPHARKVTVLPTGEIRNA